MTALFLRKQIFVYHAAFHHKSDILQCTDVLQGIGGDGNDVSVLPCFDAAHVLCASDQVGGAGGGSADGLGGGHSELDHVEKLFGVVSVRINAGIRAKGHLGPGLHGFLKIFALGAAYHFFFVNVLLGEAKLYGFSENVIIVVDVHDQVCAMLFGQTDAFIVNQAGVLNGIKAGKDRILDALSAVSMGGNLASGHVGFFGSGLQFLEGKLRRARTIALGEYASSSQNFDHVHAVLYLRAHNVANLINAVGNL